MCKPIYEGEKAAAFLSLFENDKTLQKIAELVYVDGLTYSEVATIIGYSERQIGRLCKKIKQISEQMQKPKKYIDQEALKNDGHLCYHDGKGNVYYEVDHAPAADVVEVRHGAWVCKHETYGKILCSLCKEEALLNNFKEYVLSPYCPNCGAIMDGKDD